MRFREMKTTSSVLGLAWIVSLIQVEAKPQLSQLPLQTFYVPIKEREMFNDMMKVINSNVAKAPVESMFAIAISADNTIIWYDHWEDGYDIHVEEIGNSTEVWGDGDSSNGCPPDVKPCTDSGDVFKAGDSLVVQNSVHLDATYGKRLVYGGGDRIVASDPITLVRGGYPKEPGSLMAGSVEVLDVKSWGTEYDAPVGVDIGLYFAAFEFCSFFFMAAEDNTEVTLPNGKVIVLNQGDSGAYSATQGDRLLSSKPIQVDFITGDTLSFYELRWFALWPTTTWSNSYMTPVGDTVGRTKLLLFNPTSATISIDVTILVNGLEVTKTETMKKRKATLTDVVPTDSGAIVKSKGGEKFIALSFTDTEYRTSTGQITDGQWYDWGFAVTPTYLLTPQVLIGWGYGCTDNNCFGNAPRSVIWITPTADADIYIDYDNSGDKYEIFPMKKLTSSKFVDKKDSDMSGAFIFATVPKSGPNGRGVPIAAAWGQDPAVSRQLQSISMDLGTVILPFPALRAAKAADSYEVGYGETLKYTIKIMSVGFHKIKASDITVFDKLDPMVSYVPQSASYIYRHGSNVLEARIPDSLSGTPFPLDAEGFTIPVDIDARGASVDIIFSVKVDGKLPSKEILNAGQATWLYGAPATFSELTTIVYEPMIEIENTVYLGSDGGGLCGSNSTEENVEDITGADVTYCFVVTNSGNTPLGSVTVVNGELSFSDSSIGVLAPGASAVVYLSGEIARELMNNATVSGTPLYADMSPIPDMPIVKDNDTSSVTPIQAMPSINITNTVYLGSDDGAQCSSALEYVEAADGTSVVYCFNVTNTGNTYLSDVTISNAELSVTSKEVGDLSPGESKLVFVTSSIPSIVLKNVATATGRPTFASGRDMNGIDDVFASDDSSVGPVMPSINVTNTVYLGSDDGAQCSSALEYVEAPEGTSIVYCFNVTNTGNTHLSDVAVSNAELSVTSKEVGDLSPGESKLVFVTSSIPSTALKNVATATGNPTFASGKDIDGVDNVFASDESSVGPVFDDGDTRSGDRDPYRPPNDPELGNCLHESYADDGNDADDLVCTTEDVFIESITAVNQTTCTLGETVILNLDGSIFLSSGVFDLGWYVGTDGGDALEGTCAVNGLQVGNEYKVIDSPGGSTEIGAVSWDENSCGDVSISSGTSAFIDTPITVELQVVCSDENEDGEMDISICFTWRTDNKGLCTIDKENPSTQGKLADLYPGSSTGCFCERYDITNVLVEKPAIAPC